MNPEQFVLMMNALPDAVIDSANAPVIRQKRKLRYLIPAAAACLTVLLAAAFYPKLRTQMPEVTEPPVITAETTAAVTAASEQTTGTQSVRTTVQTTAAVTVTVYTTAETAPAETTAEQPEAAPPKTEPPATEEPASEPTQTELPAGTTLPMQIQTAVISWPTPPDTPATEPQPVTVPVWKGRISEVDAYTPQTPADCQFSLCPQDAGDWLRLKYGIPADYDLTQHSCLLIEIRTGYTQMAVHGGELTADGLMLLIDRLDQYSEDAYIRCAIPVPDGFTLLPENCRAEYLIAENEAEYLEKRIEHPSIVIRE